MRYLPAFLLFTALTCAQDSGPAFEVASVKVNNSGPEAPNGFFPSPGRLRVVNDAKATGKSSFDGDMVMLRALLADQFQLKFHRETRRLKMQVLVVQKGGPKFQASKDQDEKERVNIRPTEISGVDIPFGHFVTILEAQLGHPIINETGLSGKYDLALRYVRDDSPDAGGPSVFAALPDLGLKLETRQAPVEVLVIDSAERPHGN